MEPIVEADNWSDTIYFLNDPAHHRAVVAERYTRITRIMTSNEGTYYLKERLAAAEGIDVELLDDEDEFTRESNTSFHDRLQALALGAGHQALEQLVSYSNLEAAIVTEGVPGTSLAELELSVVTNITSQQLAGLLNTFTAMKQRGLAADFGMDLSNIFYDPKDGFFVIDYMTEPRHGLSGPALQYLEFLSELDDLLSQKIDPSDSEWSTQRSRLLQRGIAVLQDEFGTNFQSQLDRYIAKLPQRQLWLGQLHADNEVTND